MIFDRIISFGNWLVLVMWCIVIATIASSPSAQTAPVSVLDRGLYLTNGLADLERDWHRVTGDASNMT